MQWGMYEFKEGKEKVTFASILSLVPVNSQQIC